MVVVLRFGDVVIRVVVDREVRLDESLLPFVVDDECDVNVDFRWQWDGVMPSGKWIGEDSLIRYFESDSGRIAMTKASGDVYQAKCEYDMDYRDIRCYLNQERCHYEIMNVGTLLRFVPMLGIFSYYQILFLHASQVVYRGKGIVFSAPSGTGKTTQAKLWQKYRGSKIVCNDRTLVRKRGDWLTYGYPLDGSEPVRSTKVTSLGCVVVLKQGECNQVERLKGSKALAAMMSQLVIDGWDSAIRFKSMNLLVDMMKDIPVYQLTCTISEEAVACLERKLLEDGVIVDEND